MTPAPFWPPAVGEAVTVWSFQGRGPEGTGPGVLEFHVQPVTTLSFAPGAMRLGSGARDGAAVVWSLQKDGTGDPTGAAVVAGPVAELCWKPDGRALAALDARGGVTVWRVGRTKGRMDRARRVSPPIVARVDGAEQLTAHAQRFAAVRAAADFSPPIERSHLLRLNPYAVRSSSNHGYNARHTPVGCQAQWKKYRRRPGRVGRLLHPAVCAGVPLPGR